jgi:ribonuclease D
MQSTVAECADDLGVAPEIVASKKELSAAILFGTRDSRVFSGWRKKQVGERLLQLL